PFSQVRRKGVGPLLEVDFGTGRANGLAEPGSRPIPACFGGDERPRVALEEGDIGAEAADGDVDRQRAAPADGGERVPDERRFAVGGRGEEEGLRAGGEAATEPIELLDAVGEGRRRHDFAVDERIDHYSNSRNGYAV